MVIRALVLDFDGLVIDSEQTALRSWQELYDAFGAQLPLPAWLTLIGTADPLFDVRGELERQAGRPLDWERLGPERRARECELARRLPPMRGVLDLLAQADDLGLPLGIASSSSREWVEGHLERLGILERFSAVLTRDDVRRTKPDPELYSAAVAALDVEPSAALAFEDSPNGVRAASAAGLSVIAVPSALVRHLPFEGAAVVLESLADLPLEAMIRRLP
jgi:HAD superfamily hydrolase (TIGR01509 family)